MKNINLTILTRDEVIADRLKAVAALMVPKAGLIKAGFIVLPKGPRPLPRRVSEAEMRRTGPVDDATEE